MHKFLLSAILALTLASTGTAGSKKLWAKSMIGKQAPKLAVADWIGEKPNTDGKWVLIDFWATWCGPCRKAIPHMNEFHKKFGDRLVVIGLSDEKKERVAAFKKPAIQYFNAVDPAAKTKKAYEVKGVPHVVIIDPAGVVRWEGFPFLSGHELTETVIAKLLGPAPSNTRPTLIKKEK